MPVLAILSLMVQIACAVHCVRSGRETFWIYIILFLPGFGSAIYIITQVLPELRYNRRLGRARNGFGKAVNPHGEMRRLQDQLELSDNIDNRLLLADEYVATGTLDKALELYQGCLTGPYRDDPHILLKLATAQFMFDQPEKARESLEHLISTNPDFNSTDGHLLYARSLERLGETQPALEEYAALEDAYPGEEARIRYADLLKENGQTEKAVELYRKTLLRSKRAPSYYKRAQKRWIKIAKENLAA